MAESISHSRDKQSDQSETNKQQTSDIDAKKTSEMQEQEKKIDSSEQKQDNTDNNIMYPNASISSVANTTHDDVSPGLPMQLQTATGTAVR